MAYRFFENVIKNSIDTNADQMYRDLQQSFVSAEWDNTSAKFCIEEQDAIGSSTYHNIEVWVTPTVADTTRGMVDTNDFLKIVFESIDHTTKRGLMYKFDNNYWLVHSYAPYNGIVQDCGIRRCNNTLKIKDPDNGKIFSIPCIIDYDMASASVQVSRYLITPNNHAVVMVQGNVDTVRLFKTNSRFILSGRPFKLYGFQNAIEYDLSNTIDTLLYLDLYLDEIRDGDDVVNGIADNGDYTYSLSIHSDNLTLPNNSNGTLSADVILNGNEVSRDLLWSSSDKSVVTINSSTGAYKVVGSTGASATITCSIDGNSGVYDTITITVGVDGNNNVIVTNPALSVIRQYQSIPFDIQLYHNGELITDNVTYSASTSSDYMSISTVGNKYVLTCSKIATVTQTLNISAQCASPSISVSDAVDIKTVSMMG